ncbi:MAG: alpha/beta fold hydrolase [Polyangiaceae bacterium]|jgi:alpha-beta hydrolase superfamily lysophospholipase
MAAARRNAKDPGLAEAIEVHTSDGHVLRATVREPKKGERAQGVAVLAHAMFARKSEWERGGAGLARFLSDRGWRTIAFDFRGHGESGTGAAKGGSWTYEDLVQRDLPAVVEGARARGRGKRVIVVGHSLGGHVAAAAQATGTIDVDAIALVASNVWLEEIEPLYPRTLAKRAIGRAMETVCRRRGYFPARWLRLGSDDEAAAYMGALWRVVERGFWGNEDGRIDYWERMRDVAIPLLALASDGDPINAHPECAARFALRARGMVTIDRIRRGDDGGAAPGHMEIVTSERSLSAWGRLEAWMRG